MFKSQVLILLDPTEKPARYFGFANPVELTENLIFVIQTEGRKPIHMCAEEEGIMPTLFLLRSQS